MNKAHRGSERSQLPVLPVASRLRILHDFAGFCRGRGWIFFVFRARGLWISISGFESLGGSQIFPAASGLSLHLIFGLLRPGCVLFDGCFRIEPSTHAMSAAGIRWP